MTVLNEDIVQVSGPAVYQAKRRPMGWFFWICVGWLVLVVASAVIADWLPLIDPLETEFLSISLAPNGRFWFGTDALGRDIFSRVLYGTRVSLIIGVAVPVIALSIGLLLGLTAGYFRGWVEQIILFYVNVTMAFPGLVLLLVVLSVVGADLLVLILLFGIYGNGGAIRIARANTLNFATREFVLAAEALGATKWRIIFIELMPNVALPLISISLLAVSGMIVFEGALSFLGLSIPPPAPTWGNMIAQGLSDLTTFPWVWGFPAAALFLTVLALNFIGDVVRQVIDGRDSAL